MTRRYRAAYAALVRRPDLGISYTAKARAHLAAKGEPNPRPADVVILAEQLLRDETCNQRLASFPAAPWGHTQPDTDLAA